MRPVPSDFPCACASPLFNRRLERPLSGAPGGVAHLVTRQVREVRIIGSGLVCVPEDLNLISILLRLGRGFNLRASEEVIPNVHHTDTLRAAPYGVADQYGH